MTEQPLDLLWTQPDWRAQADAWIQAQLSRLGFQMTSPMEPPHLRSWSMVQPVSTTQGTLYFKASSTFSAHETALTALLSANRPDCIPHVLAADLERRWMLMSEGGERLRALLEADKDIRHWQRILPLYAGLQIEMADHTGRLLEMGLPDHRLVTLPARYSHLLADTETLRIGHPEGLTADEYRRLCEYTPKFASLCEQLAAYGIPETLQHDDLHDGNILVDNDRYRIFDWGDSCISHPFFTLIVTWGSLDRTLGLAEDGPEIRQLRNLYLDSWTFCLPREALEAAFALAHHVGMVCRALTWYRLVSQLEGALKAQYIGSVSGWLQEFLAATNSRPQC